MIKAMINNVKLSANLSCDLWSPSCRNEAAVIHHMFNYNVEHDIITHDANSASWAEIWEFSKSQHGIIDAVTISKIIVFEIIT